MTPSKLRAYTRKELAERAKRRGIPGWHEMRKEELVSALAALAARARRRAARSNGHAKPGRSRTKSGKTARRSAGSVSANGHAGGKNGATRKTAVVKSRTAAAKGKSTTRRQPASQQNANGNGRGLSHGSRRNGRAPSKQAVHKVQASRNGSRLLRKGWLTTAGRDRLVAQVCDPHWLLVRWALTKGMLDRAEAALGIEWHQAAPVIRLFDVTSDDGGTATKTWVRDVEIHGAVDHWYIPVDDPPRSYRLQIGYRTPSGTFFVLAHSNKVKTTSRTALNSAAHAAGNDSHHDGGNGSHRSGLQANGGLGFPAADMAHAGSHAGNGRPMYRSHDEFEFHLETELIIYGTTHPNAVLTLLGDPVKIDKEGRFSLRYQLPNGRQVIPAVAITPNGAEQRTIVLGIERNTKELEPQNLEEHAL